MPITRVDQGWSTDISCVRLRHGFVYLVAIMDWYSQFVMAWELSGTVDGQFCLEALPRALAGRRPEIFNTDQGDQFTSELFTGTLRAAGVQISMDGRGRALDNVFVERLWRSVKYVEVYLKDYWLGARCPGPPGPVLPVLQPRPSASGLGVSAARGGVRPGEGRLSVTGGRRGL